jgi:uncharacterized repeat protein (TIGR04061 family)
MSFCNDVRPDGRVREVDLLDALLIPDRQGMYPRDSRAFVRIDTSLRVYWHTLFDICPALLDLGGADGLAIFRPFMAWAAEHKLSMNWTIYLWLYRWLAQSSFAERITDDLILSLMAASAARWATGDRGMAGGIVIACSAVPELVVGWKCRSVGASREVESLHLEESLPQPDDGIGWFVVPGFELNQFPGWEGLPR